MIDETARIHPTAIIGERVEIGAGAEIGPYTIIESDAFIGADTRVRASAFIGSHTHLGERNQVFPYCTIGVEPQDLKYAGEATQTVIGNDNVIREHVTIHRGTSHGAGKTQVGNQNLLMVGTHIAHDCFVGHGNILAQAATLAGHVTVGSHATIGAYSGVHQFCRVGDFAFIGGYSVITQDALPFVKSVGNRAKIYGINSIGLERQGFTPQETKDLKSAYRTLFQRKLRLAEALGRLRTELAHSPRVQYLVTFIEQSERGIVR